MSPMIPWENPYRRPKISCRGGWRCGFLGATRRLWTCWAFGGGNFKYFLGIHPPVFTYFEFFTHLVYLGKIFHPFWWFHIFQFGVGWSHQPSLVKPFHQEKKHRVEQDKVTAAQEIFRLVATVESWLGLEFLRDLDPILLSGILADQ